MGQLQFAPHVYLLPLPTCFKLAWEDRIRGSLALWFLILCGHRGAWQVTGGMKEDREAGVLVPIAASFMATVCWLWSRPLLADSHSSSQVAISQLSLSKFQQSLLLSPSGPRLTVGPAGTSCIVRHLPQSFPTLPL